MSSTNSYLLSIIIPVYNVQDYVAECLHSVLGANGSYEIIIVNDGTPDRSMDIVRELTEGLPNITIIEQENQGLSVARMNGLAIAKGEYVWFIDSDDYLLPDGLKHVLNLLEADFRTDVFIFPLLWCYDDSSRNHPDIPSCQAKKGAGKDMLKNDCFPRWATQRFVCKRMLFNHSWLFFPEGKLHEDIYFSIVIGYITTVVQVLPNPVYAYRIREGSIMTTRGIRSSYDMLDIYKLLKDFSIQFVMTEDQEWFNLLLAMILRKSFWDNQHLFGTDEFRAFMLEKRGYLSSEYKAISKSFSIEQRIKDWLLFYTPVLYKKLFDWKMQGPRQCPA